MIKGKNRQWVSRILVLTFILSTLYSTFIHKKISAQENGTNMTIVEQGQGKAVIVVPDNGDGNIEFASNLLKEYIKKSTGAELEVKSITDINNTAGIYENMIKIYIGFIAPESEPNIQADLEGVTNDGYLIRPYGDGITIIGPTSWGTRFGVCNFLERYAGVFWLMPGEDGEYVPELDTVSVPRVAVREEPAFTEGIFYIGGDNFDWLYKNRRFTQSSTELNFSHNLHKLFPPEEYAQTHPEIYPIINGKRYIPGPEQVSAWQPRFTEPVTVSIAVYKIKEYFDANPAKSWFALGVNDSGGYSEEYIKDAPLNSVGLANVSEIYYQWVNEVVHEVCKDPRYQDKKFGLIAYDWVADPPSFELDEHIVPFLTKDRMAWIDTEVAAKGKLLNELWHEKASALGWYDYAYGGTYAVPRIYMHPMADNYRFARENGVKYIFSEVLTTWGEGPKYWIMSRLEWNPDLDVDDLMDQWCRLAVGEEAAPYLRQYYDYWENFWTEDIINSTWFQTHKNRTYLHFYDASYLNAPTSQDMAVSRELLERVLEKAQTAKEKMRAQMLYRVFEYYEATVLSYPREYEEIKDEATALSYLEDGGAINSALTMAVKRYEIIDREIGVKPQLLDRDPRYLPAMNWNGLNSSQFSVLNDYMRRAEPEGGPVADRVTELAQSTVSSRLRDFARLLLRAWKDNYIISDPSFEEGQPGDLKAGDVWEPNIILGGESNSIKYDNSVARTGSMSVRLDNIGEAGPAQKMPVNAGLTTVSVYYYSPPETVTRGSMVVICDLYDKDKNLLKANFAYTGRKMFRDAAGIWTRTELLFDIPETVNDIPVKYMQVYMDAYQLDDGVPAYIDDVYVYQGLDTSRLDTLLASVDSFLANPGVLHYTASSVEILKTAVAGAKLLMSEQIATATQEEIEEAAGRISEAFEELVLLPLIPEIKAYLSSLPYDEDLSWAEEEGNQEGINYDRNAEGAEFSVKVDGEVKAFEKSVGTIAPSKLYYDLTGKGFEQFEAFAGIDLNSPVQAGIAYNMPLEGNNTFGEADVTTGLKHFGEDLILSFRISGNSDGNSYFRTKNQAGAGQAPVLELTLEDGTTRTLVVSENSQVKGGENADTNFHDGSEIKSQLVVSRSANPVLMRNAFLRFDLRGAGMSVEDIEAAKLKLYKTAGNSTSVQITALSNDRWNPSTITWNNQPEGYLQSEIDADKGPIFRIYGDGKLLYDSGAIGNRDQNARALSIPIIGIQNLCLEVEPNGSLLQDKAVWADARFLTYDITDIDRVTEDKSALTWNVIKGQNSDENSVAGRLNLIDKGVYGSAIAWSASPSGFINTETGDVARPYGQDQRVKLTADISSGTASDTKEFWVYVASLPLPEMPADQDFFK